MGDGVFGNPITDITLKGLPEYEGKDIIVGGLPEYEGKKIRNIDRARVAMRWKNAERKDFNALQYVQNLKENCEDNVATLCLIYNATGDVVEYAAHYDQLGHLGAAPYPSIIENGQWGAFLHRKVTDGYYSGSVGGVVYRGKNGDDADCDWLVAWNNPTDKNKWVNRAYTEVREINHFNGIWNAIHGRMDASGVHSKSESHGCLSYASIGSDRFAIFRAILTLQNVFQK
ncbi:hypothetical protein FEM48_Zijuj01G0181700 [Ziziphus jujuba var. spinosa]|uniref:23 kDa jasmonate-induced protein-like n=1 Tax=Ziziphus jujuba var. spinosa TaxID=714518 RepID=A0A978W2S9_ZIZJJ|nr:hypothetical protein FEM48_Zijuj01G0181700 [Ziziphus jujuba var. spinosa]